MKKFVKQVLVFILPIIIIVVVLEGLLQNIPNRFKLQSNYLNKNTSHIETVILGSSHTMYGLNPVFISGEVFNASNVSQTLEVDYEILKHYNKKLVNLETVIIRLSYTTLFEQLSEGEENWRYKDYNLYSGINLDYKLKHYSELLSVKFNTNLERCFDYYIFGKSFLDSNTYGWGVNAKSTDSIDMYSIGKIRAQRCTIEDLKFYDKNKQILNDLISFCKNRDVEVILITLPAFKSYVNHLNSNQLEKTVSFGNLMSEEYDNCEYYNFLSNSNFVYEDFFDSDHLNHNGAKKLSLLINNILLNK